MAMQPEQTGALEHSSSGMTYDCRSYHTGAGSQRPLRANHMGSECALNYNIGLRIS